MFLQLRLAEERFQESEARAKQLERQVIILQGLSKCRLALNLNKEISLTFIDQYVKAD